MRIVLLVFILFVSTFQTCYDFQENKDQYPPEYEEDPMETGDTETRIYQNAKKMRVTVFEDNECSKKAEDEYQFSDGRCMEIGTCYNILERNWWNNESIGSISAEEFQFWLFEDGTRDYSFWGFIDYFSGLYSMCNYTDAYLESEIYEKYDRIVIGQCTKMKMGRDSHYVLFYLGCSGETFLVYLRSVIAPMMVIFPIFFLIFCFFCCGFASQTICFCCFGVFVEFFQNAVHNPFEMQQKEEEMVEKRKEKMKKQNIENQSSKILGMKNLEEEGFAEDSIFSENKIEVEKLMNPIWLKMSPEFRDFTKFSEKLKFLFKSIVGIFLSITMLVYHELKNFLAIYVAFVCFLNTDIAKTDPEYPQMQLLINNFTDFFVIILFIYIIIQVTLLIWWIREHLISPIKVTIIYGLYQEWIVFRLLLSCVYVFYCVYGVMAFIQTQERIINEINSKISQNLFSIPNWTSAITLYGKFLISELILGLSIFLTLKYDGYSSINYYHRIKDSGLLFPMVNMITRVNKSVDDNLSTLLFMCSLIVSTDERRIKRDIQTYQRSTDFGHMPWVMISGLTGKEIIYLKFKIFRVEDLDSLQLKKEEELKDILLYMSPLKLIYWKSFFFYTLFLWFRRRRSKEELLMGKIQKQKDLLRNNTLLNILGDVGLVDDHDHDFLLDQNSSLFEKVFCFWRRKKKKNPNDQKKNKELEKKLEKMSDEERRNYERSMKEKERLRELAKLHKEKSAIKKENKFLQGRLSSLCIGSTAIEVEKVRMESLRKINDFLKSEIINMQIRNVKGVYKREMKERGGSVSEFGKQYLSMMNINYSDDEEDEEENDDEISIQDIELKEQQQQETIRIKEEEEKEKEEEMNNNNGEEDFSSGSDSGSDEDEPTM